MASPQTLSERDRRVVAAWAADCAEHVLGIFEAEAHQDDRPRMAIARARAFARGEMTAAEGIAARFAPMPAAREVDASAAAAARAAGQAAAVSHMGAHALGAAAYAAKAVGLADPDDSSAVQDEVAWQLEHMTDEVRAALRQLPRLGEDKAGPLGPGLLTQGVLATVIRDLQRSLHGPSPSALQVAAMGAGCRPQCGFVHGFPQPAVEAALLVGSGGLTVLHDS